MTEQKKPIGRPTIYDGSQVGRGYTELNENQQSETMERTRKREQIGMRKREQENEAKMRRLRVVLGVLIVLLIAAIFYEIVLGHGIKMTGQERMAFQKQQKQVILIEEETETTAETD